MRVRIPGWLAWVATALVALVALLVAWSFTPQAARSGRDWVVQQVAQQWQLDLATSRLRVNLLTRRAVLEDVRLSAPGHATEAFFTARRVAVTLPWAVFRGRVQLTTLDVEGGRVLLVREGGVMVNLRPPSGDPPPETPRRLDIRGLQVRDLVVDYVDRTGDVDVSVSGLTAALDEGDIRVFTGASGTIGAAAVRVRMGERTTTSGRVEGRMAFDGSNVSLQALTTRFPEAGVAIDGRINRVLDTTDFALTVGGTFDLVSIFAWTPPIVPVSGAGTFEGSYEGPLGSAVFDADFAAPETRIGDAPAMPLTGTMVLTSSRLSIEPFTLTALSGPAASRPGIVTGGFAYALGGKGTTDVTAAWRDLDLDVALAAYQQGPIVFAAWQDGTAAIHRAGPDAPMALQAKGTSRVLARTGRVAVDGSWSASRQSDRWTFRHDHRMLDGVRAVGTIDWPSVEAPSAAPLSGPLALEIADLSRTVRAARRSGIDLSESLANFGGPASGDLAMDGTTDAMVIRGRVEAGALTLPSDLRLAASADIVYDLDSLSATRFTVATSGGQLEGRASMGMESGRLSGAFTGAITDLPALLATAGLTGVSGSVAMSGTIGGTTDVPSVPFHVTASALAYGETALGEATADGRLLGTEVRVDELRLDQGPGLLTGKGRFDYLTGAYDASVDVQQVRVVHPLEGAPIDGVRLDGTFAGSGTIDRPGGQGRLRLTPVGGPHDDVLGPTLLTAQFSDGRLNATAFVASLRTWAQATVDPVAPYAFRGLAVVSALDVQPIALTFGALRDAVAGTVGMSATFEGTLADLTTARAFVNLQEMALTVGGLPVGLDRPVRLTLTSDDVAVDDLAATAGRSHLTASGRLRDVAGAPLRAAFTGTLDDVMTIGRALGALPDVIASGPVTATWQSRGGLRDATVEVAVTGASVTAAGLPAIEGVTLTAGFDGTTVTVEPMRATWQGALIEGRARVPRTLVESALGLTVASPTPGAPGRVDLTMRGLTQQVLAPWVPASTIAQLDARVSATLGLDVLAPTLAGLSGTLIIDEATLTAAGVPITQAHPGRVSVRGRTVSFDDVAFSADTPVVIAGTVTVGEAATSLDLSVTGTPGLRPFSVLTPSMAIDGAAVVDLRLTGTLQAPRLTGTVDLDDAELVLREPRVIASDVMGRIVFEGETVRLAGLHGFLNGGDFEVSGAVAVLGVDGAGGTLTLQARGAAIEYPANVDSEIDALLTFSPGPGQPSLTGDVSVQRSSYRAAISLPALLALSQRRPAATAQTAASYAERIRLDLALTTVDDIAIDNNFGRLDAGATLRLQGTALRPGATGRVDLREGGELFVLGGVYRLNESSVSLTNPATIEPDLNISAVTSTSGYEETLTLSGTLDRLSTTVSSSNPDASETVLDVLLRTNSASPEDALALLSGELLGVGRAVGLDSLRVERGVALDEIRQDSSSAAAENIDPTTRLTLSKRLRSDVEVILSQDLASSGLSAVVSYRPWPAIELRATQLDDSDRNYAIRHQITIGGPTTAVAPRRALPRVAEVALDGAPAADAAALRRLLRLTAGDRFDFVDWREDIDRLRRWYQDRGQWEARIRASRVAQADGTTALTYRISPGPQTALDVEGTAVSTRLRRALEDAWARAVFDRFLLDELRELVRVDLVRRNLIGAVVDVAFTESSETRKIARVLVSGGRQARARRVRYDGALTRTPAELDTQIAAAGLADDVWMEPQAVVTPLTVFYYAAGYRHAVVTANPVVFEDDVAVLHVTIDEAAPTMLASVTYVGVDDALRESVASAARLREGQAYQNTAADEARRRIEAAYQTRGFNRVVVTSRLTEDAAARTVSLTFDVEPGALQRLSEVVVAGAERTRESAVVSALGLKPGTPVDYAAWAQARKRVYDTNAFRQVDVQPEVVATGADPEPVRARVTVTEWPTWRLRYGLLLDDALSSTETGGSGRSQDLGVTADVQNRNVLGRAFTFGVTARAEREFQYSSTYFTFPTLFGRAIQTNVVASMTREDLALVDTSPDYRDTTTQLSVEQRVRRGRAFQFVYGYRVKRAIRVPIEAATDDVSREETFVGRLTGSLFTDRRDNPFNARRGWFGAVNAAHISEFESGPDTIRVLATGYRYQTVGAVTLASALRLGMSFMDPLGLDEEFFTGGADTVRGYAEDAVGPRNLAGLPRGGNALLVLNQEVRIPLWRWVRAVAFVDAGNVFAANRDVSLGALQVGYGGGFRFDTPFSIFRIDVGWPATGRGQARWYIGLGQVF